MNAIRINGIRVGHQMYHLRPHPGLPDAAQDSPLYLTLTRAKMNMPCLGLERSSPETTFSCCIEAPLMPEKGGLCPSQPATMVSVYPHGCKTATLGRLLSLFGEKTLPFFHMVSSNAMITFVLAETDRAKALCTLESAFDLPPTHTPYEPGFHEETAAFVKRRYQETRAYFQEQRIKTYGFSLESGLVLTAMDVMPSQLSRAGSIISSMDEKFFFSLALWRGPVFRIFCLTQGAYADAGDLAANGHGCKVDLITFHGPHFGDRFGIFNQAASCLNMAEIPVIQAGCTGASVSLVVPDNRGRESIAALERGFETP